MKGGGGVQFESPLQKQLPSENRVLLGLMEVTLVLISFGS